MMDQTNRQIKLGVVMSYVSICINILTGLVYTPWVILSIGRENYGLFTLANSVIMFFMFDFGLSSAVARFTSKYLAEGRQDKVNNFLGIVYKLYWTCDIVFLIVLSSIFFFIPDIYKELTPEEIEKFKIIYVIAGIYSVISFPFIPVNGILTANEKFVQVRLCDVIQKIFIVVTMSGCLLLGYGLYALVLVNAFAGVISIVLKLFCISKFTKTKVNLKYSDKNEFHNILGFSSWTMLTSLAQRFIITIAPSILGIFTGSVGIAILGIAISIEGYAYTFSNAIGGMFLPRVSRAISTDEEILPLMIKVGRIQYMIVGFITLAIICLGAQFIQLWVGDDFKDSYLCVVLMVLPSFFFTPEEIANQAILAKNKVKYQAKIYVICSAINIIIAFLLSKNLGSLGIAVSVCFTYSLRGIWLNLAIYKKELNINIYSFFRLALFPFVIPNIFILGVFALVNAFIPSDGWMDFILRSMLFTSLYCIWIFIKANSYEREMFLKPIMLIKKRSR